MTEAKDLTSKRALTLEKIAAIDIFWQSVTQTSFKTSDHIRIAYATNFKRPQKPYIVIVPGRSEGYLKYQELAYDLDNQGYDSVIIDHRGQGLSMRLTTNRLQGYVANFDQYAQDLQQLLYYVLPEKYPQHQQSSFMLAHSMGGAIALRYLQLYPHKVKALSLSSPMIAISSGGTPDWLAKALIKTGSTINRWLSNTPWYFFGQSDDNQSSFAQNRLMHSAKRFQRFQSLYQAQPTLKLGGVTFNWLDQAIINTSNLFIDIEKLSLPIQILQAENEQIVDNKAQDNFCLKLNNFNHEACPSGKPIIISGAYHELFFEIDQYRDIAIDNTIAWFSQHQ
ncbi:alpha/beta fold hydrolase [Colwellia sp. C1TZA3]|uniref:alpha/beta fold hydrolase n=1 Tax=Colwellia sp. C1TZA3 TaxID=2508879 RepID=UPI00174C0702|nr:alpha/beta fold hydrolase [Colwellia sp. C1TZA3]